MIALFLAFAAQSAAQSYDDALSIKAQAETALNACVSNQARKWSKLADSASAIADGTLYICRESLDLVIQAERNTLLSSLMKQGSSTDGFEQLASTSRQLTVENYRNGVIAVVLDERFKNSSK